MHKIKIYKQSDTQLWYIKWDTLEHDAIIEEVEVDDDTFNELEDHKNTTLERVDEILLEQLLEKNL